MAFPQGIDFRGSFGFVTDPTNSAVEVAGGGSGTYPRTTPQGNTVGWQSLTDVNNADRSASVDARLAGINYHHPGTTPSGIFYEIDLPSAGSYTINAAIGDEALGHTLQGLKVFDNLTLLATIGPTDTFSPTVFLDATGTLISAASWPSSNASITLTFASTKAVFNVLTTGTDAGTIAHIFIQSAGGGGRTIAATNTLGDFTDAAPFQNIDHIAAAELLSPFVDNASFINIDHIVAAEALGILLSAAVLKNLSHLSASDPLNGFQSNAAFHNSAGPALTNMYPWARRRRR